MRNCHVLTQLISNAYFYKLKILLFTVICISTTNIDNPSTETKKHSTVTQSTADQTIITLIR